METIFTLDIKSNVIKTVQDVFATMLSLEIETVNESDEIKSEEMSIVGSVNFAGHMCGVFHIHVQRAFALLMTSAMLGMEADEIEGEDEIRDVICEVTNIVGGNLKSFFNDSGFYCALSTPSITSGDDFIIESLNTERYEKFSFKYQEYRIWVEIGIKLQSGYVAPKSGDGAYIPKIDVEKMRDLDISSTIKNSVTNVFNTMLSMDAQVSDAVSQSVLEGMRTVGAVSFAGDAMGLVNIHVTSRFSMEMAASMLDMPVEEIDAEQDVNDVISELSNIIGGNLKSIFSDSGLRCELSTPSVTRGSDFKIESMQMDRYERFAFSYNDNVFFVEFGLKMAEGIISLTPVVKEINYEVINELSEAKEDIKSTQIDADPSTDPIQTFVSQPETESKHPTDIPDFVPDWMKERKTAPPSDVDLSFLLDIPLEVSIELGRSRMKIKDLLKISEQAVIELNELADEPVAILVNNKLIARGEVLVEGGKYGIRVLEVLSRMDRLKSLR